MAKTTLWDTFDGEPFMENPSLGILGSFNPKRRKPKRRKRGLKMAVRRRKGTSRRRRRATGYTIGRKPIRRRKLNAPRRRRRARRNAWPVAGLVSGINPRRRRRSRMSNPRRRHHTRRRHRSNPFGIALPSIKSIAFAGIGFASPSLVSGFLTSAVPSLMQQTTNLGIAGKYLVRIGSVLGISWLVKRFVGQNEANMILIGGGANIALTLVNDFAPGMLPANPLAMYIPTYIGGSAGQRSMGAYVPLRGLRAVPPIAGPSAFPAVGSRSVHGAFGGSAVRFKRF